MAPSELNETNSTGALERSSMPARVLEPVSEDNSVFKKSSKEFPDLHKSPAGS